MVDWQRRSTADRLIKVWGDELIPLIKELIVKERHDRAAGRIPLWRSRGDGSYLLTWDEVAGELTLRGRCWTVGITWFGKDGADLAVEVRGAAVDTEGSEAVLKKLDQFLRRNLFRGDVEYQLLGPWTGPDEKHSWEAEVTRLFGPQGPAEKSLDV
jgi:hypothetical protein